MNTDDQFDKAVDRIVQTRRPRERHITVKKLMEWIIKMGPRHVVVILPATPLVNIPFLSKTMALRVLAVRQVVKEQQVLTSLLVAGLAELPNDLRPMVATLLDNPNKARQIMDQPNFTGTGSPDLIISIHPVNPPLELSDVMQTRVLLEE